MRGSHYGTDSRWFGRAFDLPGKVDIPKVDKEGAQTKAATTQVVNEASAFHRREHVLQKLMGRIHEEPPTVAASREPRGEPQRLSPVGVRAEQGAFRRAVEATRGSDSLPPQVADLLDSGILAGTQAADLALTDIDRLHDALSREGLRPSDGVQIVEAWARSRRISPEDMLDRLRSLRANWLEEAKTQVKPGIATPLAEVRDWDGDDELSSAIGQRSNAGYGPKGIDHERLQLLRMMMDSFAGQVNYGFAPPT